MYDLIANLVLKNFLIACCSIYCLVASNDPSVITRSMQEMSHVYSRQITGSSQGPETVRSKSGSVPQTLHRLHPSLIVYFFYLQVYTFEKK